MNNAFITLLTSGKLIGVIPNIKQGESNVTNIYFVIPSELHNFNHRVEFKKPNYEKVSTGFLEEIAMDDKHYVALPLDMGIVNEVGEYSLEYVATKDDKRFISDRISFIVEESILSTNTPGNNQRDMYEELKKALDGKVDKEEGKGLITDKEKKQLQECYNVKLPLMTGMNLRGKTIKFDTSFVADEDSYTEIYINGGEIFIQVDLHTVEGNSKMDFYLNAEDECIQFTDPNTYEWLMDSYTFPDDKDYIISEISAYNKDLIDFSEVTTITVNSYNELVQNQHIYYVKEIPITKKEYDYIKLTKPSIIIDTFKNITYILGHVDSTDIYYNVISVEEGILITFILRETEQDEDGNPLYNFEEEYVCPIVTTTYLDYKLNEVKKELEEKTITDTFDLTYHREENEPYEFRLSKIPNPCKPIQIFINVVTGEKFTIYLWKNVCESILFKDDNSGTDLINYFEEGAIGYEQGQNYITLSIRGLVRSLTKQGSSGNVTKITITYKAINKTDELFRY